MVAVNIPLFAGERFIILRNQLSSMSKSNTPGARPSEPTHSYAVGYGKPPLHSRFKKGQSGNPRGRREAPASLDAILLAALRKKVAITENGRRRRVTKCQAVIAQLVDKSAAADLRATKMLLELLRDIERRMPPAADPNPADAEILDALKTRLRRLAEAHGANGPEPEENTGAG